MSHFRAKITWEEGSVVCTTTVTVAAKDVADAENAFWRKFREHFGAAENAQIVARWKFNPPVRFYRPARIVKEQVLCLHCHAWAALWIAGLSVGASWGVLLALFLAGLCVMLAVSEVARWMSAPPWKPSVENCPKCEDFKLRERVTPEGIELHCACCDHAERVLRSAPSGGLQTLTRREAQR